MSTLADSFNPRRNSLNALRLALAVVVIVSHSWPIGGYGDDPGLGDQNLGAWAVSGFFAISGYLITMSRMRSRSLWDFLWRRFLRIYPAFFVALLAVGFVFAPLSVVIFGIGNWNPGAGASYVFNNIALLMRQFNVPGTLDSAPFPREWDGAMWTLFYEFLCYIGIGVLVTIVPKRFLLAALLIVFTGLTSFTCAHLYLGFETPDFLGLELPYKAVQLSRLGAFFGAGALLYVLRHRIPVSSVWAVAALGALVVMVTTSSSQAFAGIPIAYLMMFLGIRLPLQRVGASNDISYGMYIYAFPVQQILAMTFPQQTLPVGIFVLLAIVFTVPFAYASWFGIEKPAMKLKRLSAKVRIDTEGHVDRSESATVTPSI